jgi:hypothetical protein
LTKTASATTEASYTLNKGVSFNSLMLWNTIIQIQVRKHNASPLQNWTGQRCLF